MRHFLSIFLLLVSCYGFAGWSEEKREDPSKYISAQVLFDKKKEMVYVLVLFQSNEKNNLHRPWIWDAGFQLYRPDMTRAEETFTVVWRNPDEPGKYDIWVWGSDRSTGMRYADDMFAEEKDGKIVLRFDEGQLAWEVAHPENFEGEIVGRFRYMRPAGSAADVSVEKDRYEKGFRIVMLKRALSTGNDDDLVLSETSEIYITNRAPGELDFSLLEFRKITEENMLWQKH